jgi:hypothetical protein
MSKSTDVAKLQERIKELEAKLKGEEFRGFNVSKENIFGASKFSSSPMPITNPLNILLHQGLSRD